MELGGYYCDGKASFDKVYVRVVVGVVVVNGFVGEDREVMVAQVQGAKRWRMRKVRRQWWGEMV